MIEHGENLDGHLLPTLERLQAMTPAERAELRELVADWIGDKVETFRVRVSLLP